MVKYKNQQIELDRLLSYVLESGASDLHLLVGKPPIVRIDSELVSIKDYSSYDQEDLEKLISALLDDSTKARLEEQRQVDFSYNLRNSARFRVNIYYQKGTMAAALRYISSKIQTLEELNMPAQIGNFIKFRQGLVLIVGPNGHGKSTTMAAIVDMINHKRSGHIITIEDPIEYIFIPDKSIISQREVYQDAKSFVQAIRSTFREDADVVMVGANTVEMDNPRLTVRDSQGAAADSQPVRVVVDSSGRVSPDSLTFRQPGRSMVAVCETDLPWRKRMREVGVEVLVVPRKGPGVDLAALLALLGQRNYTHVLVEGGGTLLGAFFDEGLVDKVVAFVAPAIIGGKDAPSAVGGLGAEVMEKVLRLRDVEVETLGGDIVVTGYP
ncbi:MAG: Flp pilus assembly complex ATPase component TadA [Chloroflexi bacterium]|nr:Flp pilus assembly complex ATPase component TadA [Chloroflexota bacterium]